MFIGGRLNAGDICVNSGNQIAFETPDGHVQAFMKTATGDDSYGNVINDPMHAYQYNDVSNMTCVDCAGPTPTTYTYDGNNRRVTRTKSGITTYYVNAANGDLILEYTPAQNIAVEHIYLSGKRIASKAVHF